jgi:hypothetical protein
MKFEGNSSVDSSNFMKLKDGESVRGVFSGEPHEFKQHWENGRSSLCTGAQSCPGCGPGKEPASFRFLLNFITQENGAYVAKVWEQGWKVYKQLRALNEDYQLDKTVVKITRTGSKMNDTNYAVIPLPGESGVVTPALQDKLKQVKLVDLEGRAKTTTENPDSENDANEDFDKFRAV